jgi:hypothetical protein
VGATAAAAQREEGRVERKSKCVVGSGGFDSDSDGIDYSPPPPPFPSGVVLWGSLAPLLYINPLHNKIQMQHSLSTKKVLKQVIDPE